MVHSVHGKTKTNQREVVSPLKGLFPVACLILVSLVYFFILLFFPDVKLIATPDFGQSDIWNLTMPGKFFLAQSLQKGDLPLWSKDVGSGYPLLAEGQIGTFFLPNMLLFRFLPFIVAWNVGYIVTAILASLGTYLYMRRITARVSTAFFCALIFTFSSIFVTHMTHYNLIQAISLLPWLFFFVQSALDGKWWGYPGLIVAFSQQILAGFPQVGVISAFAIIVYSLVIGIKNHASLKAYTGMYALVLAFVVAGLLAGVQLVPQWELFQNSVRERGLSYEQAVYFSFPWKHLVSLVHPYALGDPRKGSYPFFSSFDGSIFWENTAFIGVVALVLAFGSVLFLGQSWVVRGFWFIAVLSLLLATGKYSPLYFVYSFAPFSFFRVPSRFIIVFVWSLIVLAGVGMERLSDFLSERNTRMATAVIGVVMALSFTEVWSFAAGYNALIKASDFLEVPPVVSLLPAEKGRIYSIGVENPWNAQFLTQGWQNLHPYLFLRNGLQANSNLFYDRAQLGVYPPLLTRRLGVLNQVLAGNIYTSDREATISATGMKFLRLYGVAFISSPLTLYNEKLQFFTSVKSAANATLEMKVYTVEDLEPRVYLATSATQAATVIDVINTIWKHPFTPQPPIVLEGEIKKLPENRSGKGEVQLILDHQQKMVIATSAETDTYLVVSDSYYPGWRATIDNEEAAIIPANINQRAVFVPKGKHLVQFTYAPQSFKIGVLISSLGLGIVLVWTGISFWQQKGSVKIARVT